MAAAAAAARRDSPALLLCSTPAHTHTHMRIYKSLLNLQGTFMQLLFDMVASFFTFIPFMLFAFFLLSFFTLCHKIDNDYVNMPRGAVNVSVCVCVVCASVCVCAAFQFK